MPAAIDDRFLQLHPGSADRADRARSVFPGGVTHDVRLFEPFGIVYDRASGPRKWDVDGNQVIDYVMGHGALLFGHSHPDLVAAVQRQIERGTHASGTTDLELQWAAAIQRLLPSAEKVRFTSSGTEATMMAVRVSRAATGRENILRLNGHFHGWNDSVMTGGSGLSRAMQSAMTFLDQTDIEAMTRELATGRYAAAILEPTGPHWGAVPLPPEIPAELRRLTAEHGTVLIFDEVVTGFRASRGGVQERLGIRPDLTTLAKIVAGGLPGGALAGRRDLLDQIAPNGAGQRVLHPGTFNANPLSAAAGAAALAAVGETDAVERAAGQARRLTQGFNRALLTAEVPGAAFADASMVHLVLGAELPRPDDGFTWDWDPLGGPRASLPETPPAVMWPFRRAMLNHGVDLMGTGALVSCVHGDPEIDATLAAFEAALADLRRDEIL